MLNPKILDQSSGAENLAGMMVSMADERNVHDIPLDELYDAPPEWNFFKPLPNGKFFELLQSIEQNGLLVPLIVWERGEGGYVILSGHNRKRAMESLHEKTGDAAYQKAPCVVYRADSLTEDEARSILVDCNWVQRTLTTTEKARAIYTKYVQLGRLPRGGNKRRYDLVAEHFGLKATQVYQYTKLSQLDERWLDKLDAGEISVKTAVHLCGLTDEQREFLWSWPGATQNEIRSIDRTYTVEDMKKVLMNQDSELRELRVMVPADKYGELMERISEWLVDC